MMTPKPFRERPRTTEIQDADIFPLSRLVGGIATTYSIAWSDVSGQIVLEVAEARQEMVDGFAATVAWANTEIAKKEPAISAGSAAQYWRGDKSWAALNKAAVGLSIVDNTADSAKPVSTAQQAALDAKANTPGAPAALSPTFGTAYQAANPAKAALISVMVETAYTITVAGTQSDTVELRIGPVQATVANGTGGTAVATFKTSLTGIALTIGLANVQRNQLSALLPPGWFYALRRVAGTTATVQGAFEQPL